MCVYVKKCHPSLGQHSSPGQLFWPLGYHQEGAEREPLEGEPLNIKAYAQTLACGCKLSKITTLACAITMTTSDHKTRVKLLPIARDSESRTVNLAARTQCVKK